MRSASPHRLHAARCALWIPEILQVVLDAIDPILPNGRKTLRAAISVNRAWADAGTSVLWRHPPAKALLLVDAAR
jgi:hypothetical protein